MFDPNNKIIKLCAEGMAMEGEGKKIEALKLFEQAWNQSANDFEKFTSAHYVARGQNSIEEKLKWDMIAIEFALKIKDDSIKGAYPSLYLNIAKCYEDLKDFLNAKKHYQLANTFVEYLAKDGYGKMIENGILSGIARTL